MSFHVSQVLPGIYHIKEEAVHFDLIVGTKKALLWDTGYGIHDLLPLLSSLTDKELIVCNSHGHIDHVGGNYAFDKVYAPLRTLPETLMMTSPEVRLVAISRILAKNIAPDRDYSKVVYTDLNESTVFDLGGRTARFLAIPGHTSHDMALWIEEDRTLFTADAVNYMMWLYFSPSMRQSIVVDSLRKLLALKPERIIASHRHTPLSVDYLESLTECIAHLRKKDFTHPHIEPNARIKGNLVAYHTTIQHKRVTIAFRDDAFDLEEKEGT